MNRIDLCKQLKNVQPNEELIDINGNPILYLYSLGNGKTVVSANKPDGECKACKGFVFNTERTHLANNYYCGTCEENKNYTEITFKNYK